VTARVFVLGVDGLPSTTFDRFLAEGVLPNCAALLARSARLDVVPTLPALTAPGWMTIASGSHPATLGITNILLPTPGAAPDTIRNGFDRSFSRGEYLWESLARVGRPATVVKFPGSWPPQVESELLTQIDGAGGYADINCRFDDLGSAAYLCGDAVPAGETHGCCSVPRGYDEHWRIDGAQESGWIPVIARDPLNWHGLPADFTPVFECVLPVAALGRRRRENLMLVAGEAGGRPGVFIGGTKVAGDATTVLCPGEWTPWLEARGEHGTFTYRLKLMSLDLAARRLHVYRTQGHRSLGFCRPADLDATLAAQVGPVSEWTGTFDYMNGLIDLDTQVEVYEQHTRWLEGVVRTLGPPAWDAFFVHWHVIEYAHHIAGSALDPAHPRHDVERAAFIDFLRSTYRLLDRLVGTALAVAEARDASLALVSDHGHDTVHSLLFVNDFLRERGWLVTEKHDEHSGNLIINWSRSRAYGLFPGLILINKKSAWVAGVVGDAERAELVEEIGEALRGLVDPRTGRHVVTAVLDRSELTAHGQGHDERVDMMFTMERGYEPATRLREHSDGLFEVTEPGSELTSGHGSFHPQSPSARTLAVLCDPRVRPGSCGRYPVEIVDIAPTLAGMIGAAPPRGCDGRALDLAVLGVAAGGAS